MADASSRAREPAQPESQWQRAFRRVNMLQRVQLLTLLTTGALIALATLGSGLLFFASANELDERESERNDLVAIRDEARELQVEVLVRRANGELTLAPADILRLTAVVTRAKERAISPDVPSTEAERQARLAVHEKIDEVAALMAATDPDELSSEIATGRIGDLIQEAFAIFQEWVAANEAAFTAERERQRQLVVRGGVGIAILVALLTMVGLLVWWRTEKARERVIAGAQAQSRRFDSLVSNSSDVVMVVDGDGKVDYCSPAVRRVLQRSADELVGTPLGTFVHPDDAHQLALVSAQHLPDGTVSEPLDLRLRRADGTWMDAETLATNLMGDDAIAGFVLTCRDVSDRKEVEAKLAHQAFHDPLTGLPNRTLFEDRLRRALDASAGPPAPVAALVLDLDDFKTVNDSLGHHAGDELLNVIGQRLLRHVRPGDTPARLGGDEFGVVLNGLAGPAAVRMIAHRIAEAVREPVRLADRELKVSTSIGVAMAPRHGDDYETLMRHADIAMYAAKARPGVEVATFDPGMEAALSERMRLSVDLNSAIDAGDQFRVVYQPIVDLRTQEILGLEALVRWEHPTEGEIMPARFIPLAESNGMIIPIGEQVLRAACAAGAAWHASTGRELTINVNVSPRQLEDPRFPDTVRSALQMSGLPAASLLLEVTESAVMGDIDEVVALLNRVKELGVRVAIDDFGTGYSSLSQLGRLPVDMVKIDKEFIDALSNGGADADVTSVILQLGAVLDLQTVAEGIELVEQVSDLQDLRCEAGQGFFFASPMDVQEISRLLAAGAVTGDVPVAAPEAG